MIFLALMLLIVLAVAFAHFVQGFFTAAISAVIAVFAACLAVSYHEIIATKYLVAKIPDHAHGVALLLTFSLTYIVLRFLFDVMIPNNVRMPAAIDKTGGAICGIVAGIFTAGIVAMAAQYMPFYGSVGGYTRYAVKDMDASIPIPGARSVDRKIKDVIDAEEVEDPVQRANHPQATMLVPLDDIVVGTVARLSTGALAGAQSVASVHPDWLLELYGQRIGMEPGGRRVAVIDDKTQDVKVEGIFALDPKTLEQREGELKVARPASRALPLKFEDPKRMLVVVRIMFAESARDSDALIRFSPGSIRLVSNFKRPGFSDYEPGNYFPIGTLDDAKLLYLSRLDDYMFVPAGSDKKSLGVDLVFNVMKDGFATGTGPLQITRDTFLVVKRLATFPLGGIEIKPIKRSTQLGLARKPAVISQATQAPEAPKKSSDDETGDEPPKPAAPKAGSAPTAAKPAAPVDAGGLQGTWESQPAGGTVISVTFGAGTLSIMKKNALMSQSITGTWTEKSRSGSEIVIHCTPKQGTMSAPDVKISLEDDKLTMSDPNGGDDMVLTRKR